MNYNKLFILFTLVMSCKSEVSKLFEFDPRALVENEITLAAIADDITYIPLDNTIPVGMVYTYDFTNNSIYLSAKDIGILVFKRDGKILGRIGAIGRGPDEYLHCTNFAVDSESGSVYVKDNDNEIKVFCRNGDFLRTISSPENSGNIELIEFHDSKLYAFNYLQFGDAKSNWIILDTIGKLINKKERAIPVFWSNWSGRCGTYIFENKVFYWNSYIDTVFSIYSDHRYESSFLISPGEHRLPRSEFDPGNLHLFMHLYHIFETKHFRVIRYGYNKRGVVALIKKNGNKAYSAFWETTENGGITNDLDGGTMFLPRSYFIESDREYISGLINPYRLKSHVASSEFKNSAPRYPEKKIELERLAASLKETDNPVLVLVRLKK